MGGVEINMTNTWKVTKWNKVPCEFRGDVRLLTDYYGQANQGKIFKCTAHAVLNSISYTIEIDGRTRFVASDCIELL
jgi:hypothetical protein